jgi:hypothetical protein
MRKPFAILPIRECAACDCDQLAQFATIIRDDFDKWTGIIHAASIQPQ